MAEYEDGFKDHNALAIACLSMAIAVSLGAMGAHALKGKLDAESLASFKTGVFYHIIHSIAILALSLIGGHLKVDMTKIVRLMMLGTVMFSFSIYLLSTRDITGLDAIGPYIGWLTPVGGLLLICSWIWSALVILKKGKTP